MAPAVTVDNDAEENSLRIIMANDLFLIGRREDSSQAKPGGVMGAKLGRHLLNALRQKTPSVKEMAPKTLVDNDAEENSLRIIMANNPLLVGKREDSREDEPGGVTGAKSWRHLLVDSRHSTPSVERIARA